MKKGNRFWYALVSIITAFTLVFSTGATVTRAEVLSGENQSTLSREPQVTPDGLGAAGLGELQYADPAAQIDLAQAPAANNQGDAEASLPLSVPPGRAGVQPDLSLDYSSTGGSGWLGLGWDLSVGAVTLDTRWGVPRYSATQESETYMLDGDQLSPTAVRSTLEPRASEKQFQRRVEGLFERVIRHGAAPGQYWWEVTDKNGMHRYYGGTPEGGRDEAAILTDASHHEYIWGLKQVRDISSNTMNFSYAKPSGKNVGLQNTSVGQGFYLSSITYTGSITANTPDDPAYSVTFTREDSPDVAVDARGGFLHVTAERLKQIEIAYRGTVVRSYTLNYTTGVFGKSLLASVDQSGAAGSAKLATHTITYYDDLHASGSTYQGYNNSNVQSWTPQSDGVKGNVDLGAFGDGKASVLGGTESLGGDGRIYLGFNLFEGQKEGSAGVGLVFKGEDDSSRLEMIDINGDNLPDKVFEQNGQVVYRLNQSGPNGATTFSDGQPLPIVGLPHLSRESNFMFSVGPELYFGVSLMYNHAWAWTWGKAYFTDVNTDGLPDFIDQGIVYFNHLNASNQPVFTENNADTAVPIDGGSIDPSLTPDLSAIEAQIRAQAPLQDVLRRWVAPYSGQVKVEGDVQLLPPAADKPAGDGVRVAIQHQGAELWSAIIPGGDTAARTPTGVASIGVNRGDAIYFRLQSIDDGASDQVAWDPQISYLSVSPTLDANGLDEYSYQASADFTLAGRSGSFVIMPLDGTVQVTGDLNKVRKTTDDVTLQVIQQVATTDSNNQTSLTENVVAEQLVPADTVGNTPFSAEFPVSAPQNSNGSLTVNRVRLVLKINSPVDLSAFSWTPRLLYTAATQNGQPIPVTDAQGKPTVQLHPPVDIQVYPGTDLSAPQGTWKADSSGNVKLTPSVQFCAADQPILCVPSSQSGTLTISVKKQITPATAGDPPAQLVAKKTLTIQAGAIQDSDPSLTFSAEKDAEYWIDLSVPEAGLGSDWRSASLDPAVTFARHWAYIPADVFPEAYRGWGIAGYNGDGEWGTKPIDASRLVFDKNDYPQSAADQPQLKDPNNPQPTYPGDFTGTYKNPAQAKSYAYAPTLLFDANGVATAYWRGAKDNLNGSAGGQSSSRLGPDSVTMPGSDSAGATAVSLRSITEADAIAGGLGGLVGGSYAWGNSKSLADFIDLNGDQFPDILGNGGAQFTQARGGRDASATPLATFDNIRKDSTTTTSFNGGGDAAEIKADSKGKSNTPQGAPTIGSHRQRNKSGNSHPTSSSSGDNSQTSGSIGISGELGNSSTNTSADASPGDALIESDLADMNGDGLPDRVRLYTDGRFTVSFNLGYAFDPQEIEWPGGSLEQGKSTSTSLSPGAGFSYGALSFSGGVSLGSSTDKPIATWVDLNGDGLPDQVSADSSGNLSARFNTGASLTGPINFGSLQAGDVARAQSQDISGGVDFTIGIGPLCFIVDLCYIIINPGVHVDGGMSRQEIEIKDVNGDGYPDHVLSLNDGDMHVLLNQTGRTNLLKTVTNPLGGSFTLNYTRQGNTTTQPYSQWVLSTVDINDGRPGDGNNHQLTSYQYSGNAFNALERDFLGYQTVTEEQRDTTILETAPGTLIPVDKAALDASFPVLRSIERQYRTGTVFDKGLLARETLRYPDNTPFSDVVYDWEMWDVAGNTAANLHPDPAGVGLLGLSVFPRQVKTTYTRYAGGAAAKTTWNTYAYDALGNITQTVDVGEPDLPADDLTSTTTYTDCTAPGDSWVSLPDAYQVTDGNGALLRSRHAELLCSNGAVTKLWEDTGSGEALTQLTFDDWGNYNQIIYPANESGQTYTVDYVYDADRHTDIASVSDSYGLTGAATYHGENGALASQTDANGQVTSYTYDEYGRLATLTGPYEQGSGQASASFEYFPTAPGYAYGLAHNFDAFHTGDTIDTASFKDGIGRETETKQDATLFRAANQPAQDAMVVGGAVEFNSLGRAVKEWYPVEEPLGTIGTYDYNTSPIPTVTTWDISDRVTKSVAPDGSVTSTAFGFGGSAQFGANMFQDVTTDALGKTTTTYSDIRGNQLALSVNHTVGNQTHTLQTTYQYDPLQQLVQVTDASGNQTTHEYDLLGRHTATTTPDAGRVSYTYDLASHLIAKQTANLQAAGGQIHYNYFFDRLTGITYTDGTPNVTYTYGDPGAAQNGAGRIIKVEDGARIQLRGYGAQGEQAAETTTMLVHNLVDGTEARLTWTTQSAFDTWGRTKSVTYPDGELVSYGYNSGGLLASIAGDKAGAAYPYLLRQEYDQFFARRFAQDGNQVATETQYDPLTRRMSRQIIDAPGRRIQDLNYSYDLVGNVLAEANNSPTPVTSLMGGTSQQTFTYDDLYRLTSATGSYTFSPGKVRKYTYDLTLADNGNILHKTQTDTTYNQPKKGIPQKKTTYDQGYSYSGAPHQPITVGTQTYTYDLNGNNTGWTDASTGQNRTVTWDAENRVTSVADQGSTTRYTYTDTGTLGLQRGPQGEISFVNRYYTVLNGTVAWKDIWAGDQRIATKKQMPDGEPELMEYFLHSDQLGSTNVITGRDGLIYQYMEYFPGGENWVEEHSDIYRVPELYTGSYYEEFRALYNFGARWYDPRQQFFYSPEPLLSLSPQAAVNDPGLLPAYTYAEANPLKLVDRSGLAPNVPWKAAKPSLRSRALRAIDPERSTHSARFKAFATFKFPPAISIKLTKNSQTKKYQVSKVKIFGKKVSKLKK